MASVNKAKKKKKPASPPICVFNFFASGLVQRERALRKKKKKVSLFSFLYLIHTTLFLLIFLIFLVSLSVLFAFLQTTKKTYNLVEGNKKVT